MSKYDGLNIHDLEELLHLQMNTLLANIEHLIENGDREVFSTLEEEMAVLLKGAGLTVQGGRLTEIQDPLAELARLIGQTDPFASDCPPLEQEYDDPPPKR